MILPDKAKICCLYKKFSDVIVEKILRSIRSKFPSPSEYFPEILDEKIN